MKPVIYSTEKEHRTEEVQDIIEKMPTKFGYLISILVLLLFAVLLIFGWFIRYPDVVSGRVVINAELSPINLVSQSSGSLQLKKISSKSKVKKGDIIAYIETPTSLESLASIKNIFNTYIPGNTPPYLLLNKLPQHIALGELNTQYYAVLNALIQLNNFNSDRIYDKQIANYQALLVEQKKEMANSENRTILSKKINDNLYTFFQRDSILFNQKASAKVEYERSYLEYLNSQNSYINSVSNHINAAKEINNINSQITQVIIQKNEKRKELELSLSASFNEFTDKIKQWEQRYLFKAPFDGEVQFLKFWTNNQNIKEGEAAFSVIPIQGTPYGQLHLPASGSGKVKVGQEVIVKLDEFPYIEYGFIKGQVIDIANTVSIETTAQGEYETYLVTVKFSNGVITNYGNILSFKQASKGIGEVITADKSLIQRFFGNLKYAFSK